MAGVRFERDLIPGSIQKKTIQCDRSRHTGVFHCLLSPTSGNPKAFRGYLPSRGPLSSSKARSPQNQSCPPENDPPETRTRFNKTSKAGNREEIERKPRGNREKKGKGKGKGRQRKRKKGKETGSGIAKQSRTARFENRAREKRFSARLPSCFHEKKIQFFKKTRLGYKDHRNSSILSYSKTS